MGENLPTDPTPAPAATENSLQPAPTLGQSLRSLLDELSGAVAWCVHAPFSTALLAGILGTLYYFFWIYHPFNNGNLSTATWASQAWNWEGDQGYDRIVPFVGLGLLWYHRKELQRAPKGSSYRGLAWVFAGVAMFVVGSRCLQPRLTLFSVPFLIYGAAMFVWGKKVARLVLFPCAFQVFMVPADVFNQVTFRLQFIQKAAVAALAPFFGVAIAHGGGTTLTASNGSFNFEIAEGCSGIRSLIAIMMLTAIFVHFTQNRLWKKVTIFSASILFAIIGNTGRILSIVLMAKYYDPKFAAGAYHETSGWISFPFAFGAMLGFDWLLSKISDTLSAVQVAEISPANPVAVGEAVANDTTAPQPGTETSPPIPQKKPLYDY